MRNFFGWSCIVVSAILAFNALASLMRAFNPPLFSDRVTWWVFAFAFGFVAFVLWKIGRSLTRQRKRRWHEPE